VWRQRGEHQYGQSLERYVMAIELNAAMNELLDVILGISRAFETRMISPPRLLPLARRS
jgi:hypothetical protein